jgi:CHASE2 domain-containing sensor protein
MPRSPFPERWKSEFASFIKAYGVASLAVKLGVNESAIRHWIRGINAPRRTHAEIIQRLARERGTVLTLDAIYSHASERCASDPALAVVIDRRQQKAAERDARRTAVHTAVADLLAERLMAHRSVAGS